ncbi:MFS transporter [Pseudoroseomonas wenyumeiae]|uniref:MFS transporter n=1 Tax=Teichococcus wenyumeiae TaxID=2478470 RepID=A0A3A9J5M4_9PROT|nr:MFS transporter [Pseudoroseomonas wenyumeiae]RKK01752.1 MFS transporter [Pseudoroseomonas wenyumeiae]RMI26876.1 MFS transporter [Pseudoroseomonas wenyumeiae]
MARPTVATRQIAFINFAHGATHYSQLILATAVLGMLGAPGTGFGTEYGPLLALGTAMFVVYGLLTLPMGWLADRVGRRRLMVIFFLGTGVCMAGAGMVSSPLLLAVALAAMGGFTAIYHPIGTAMLVEAAGDKVGRSVGVNGACGNLGVAAAPIFTALLVQGAGWRAAFMVPGLLCFAAGLLYLRQGQAEGGGARSNRPFPPIPRALVRRAVVVLLGIAAASGFVFNAFTLLLPKLLEERLSGSAGLLPVIGALAFVVTLGGAATQFTVGRMIDRLTLRRVFLPMAVVQMPLMLLLSFVGGWWVLPIAAGLAASIFGQVTVNETMTARYIAPALRAKLYSIRFFIAFIGAAAAPPAVGLLHDATGNLGATLLVLSVFSAVILLCALAFPDRKEELQPELWATVPAE